MNPRIPIALALLALIGCTRPAAESPAPAAAPKAEEPTLILTGVETVMLATEELDEEGFRSLVDVPVGSRVAIVPGDPMPGFEQSVLVVVLDGPKKGLKGYAARHQIQPVPR